MVGVQELGKQKTEKLDLFCGIAEKRLKLILIGLFLFSEWSTTRFTRYSYILYYNLLFSEWSTTRTSCGSLLPPRTTQTKWATCFSQVILNLSSNINLIFIKISYHNLHLWPLSPTLFFCPGVVGHPLQEQGQDWGGDLQGQQRSHTKGIAGGDHKDQRVWETKHHKSPFPSSDALTAQEDTEPWSWGETVWGHLLKVNFVFCQLYWHPFIS